MAGVADWGIAQVGRLTLREGFTLSASIDGSTGDRTLSFTGEESTPPLTLAELQQRQEDILDLDGRFVPITFTNKADHNGWYMIKDSDTSLTNWTGEVVKFSWTIQATRVGPENGVDIESRITTTVRQNGYAQAGERWHAPAAGAFAYYTGATVPSTGARALAYGEGSLTLYRGLAANVYPRWGSTLVNYGRGRSRVLVGSLERVATNATLSASAGAWELSNGLIKVTPGSTNTVIISAWDGSVWDSIAWNASVTASASGALTGFDAATITRNDYEVASVRLIKDLAPGRVTLDLSVRRGARFVETYLQTGAASTKSWYRATNEAATASTAYVSATANDAAGNRYVIGAANTFTNQLTVGGITKASTATLDAFIGVQVAGSGASGADVAAVIRDHYMMAMADKSVGVRR